MMCCKGDSATTTVAAVPDEASLAVKEPEELKITTEEPRPVEEAANREFSIQIRKVASSDKLGLDIVAHNNRTALRIKAVKPGLIQKWNDDHPDQPVQLGDVIVEVNSVRGNSDKILEKVRDSTLELVIERACGVL